MKPQAFEDGKLPIMAGAHLGILVVQDETTEMTIDISIIHKYRESSVDQSFNETRSIQL